MESFAIFRVDQTFKQNAMQHIPKGYSSEFMD